MDFRLLAALIRLAELKADGEIDAPAADDAAALVARAMARRARQARPAPEEEGQD